MSVLEHVKFEMPLWTSKEIIELNSWPYKSEVGQTISSESLKMEIMKSSYNRRGLDGIL